MDVSENGDILSYRFFPKNHSSTFRSSFHERNFRIIVIFRIQVVIILAFEKVHGKMLIALEEHGLAEEYEVGTVDVNKVF